LKQEDLYIGGHAIEARIYAEIPEKNFVPDSGNLRLFEVPENTSNLRIETGVQKGYYHFNFGLVLILPFRRRNFYFLRPYDCKSHRSRTRSKRSN